ncbi:phage recombination protein Bet, partial [Paenibacillus polymyxa]
MRETTELMTKQVEFSVNGESVKLTGKTVKNFLVRGNSDVTDKEAAMFINLCKYQKLNPFLNEAYLVKFKGSPAQMIVGKEAFMKRAENNEQFQGFKAGIIVEREGDMVELEGAIKLPKDNLIGG